MAQLARPDRIKTLPGRGAALGAAAVGMACVAGPGRWLETAVAASGVTALLPAAAPPLGATARAMLAVGGGALMAAIVWAALYLLCGEGGFLAGKTSATEMPAVRRADAHPDAPPRWPLSAAELATTAAPLPMAGPMIQAIPADLDTPLAAFDPKAIPAMPRAPVRAVAPLTPGERLQTFALAPPLARQRPAIEPPEIDTPRGRLEQGAGRQVAAR